MTDVEYCRTANFGENCEIRENFLHAKVPTKVSLVCLGNPHDQEFHEIHENFLHAKISMFYSKWLLVGSYRFPVTEKKSGAKTAPPLELFHGT